MQFAISFPQHAVNESLKLVMIHHIIALTLRRLQTHEQTHILIFSFALHALSRRWQTHANKA